MGVIRVSVGVMGGEEVWVCWNGCSVGCDGWECGCDGRGGSVVVGGRGREACVMREREVSLEGVRECGCDGWEGVCEHVSPARSGVC